MKKMSTIPFSLYRKHVFEKLFFAVQYVHGMDVAGDIAEFGTMTGETASVLAGAIRDCDAAFRSALRAANATPKQLHLFDSFAGLPPATSQPDRLAPHVRSGVWGPGTCAGLSKDQLFEACAAELDRDRIKIVEGWFHETIPALPTDTCYGLVHVDCDLYASAAAVLDNLFMRGMVAEGGMILFDDWNCNRASPECGERLAWSECVSKYRVRFSDAGNYGIASQSFIIHNYERPPQRAAVLQTAAAAPRPISSTGSVSSPPTGGVTDMATAVIAEVGCNHKGSMDIAREMIRMAKMSGATVVKFQKRNPLELLTKEQYEAPHPDPHNSYGATYGAHREALEFTLDQHRDLKAYCEEVGVVYSTSVWDLTSARRIASLEPQLIKIPSASNLHFEMLDWLCCNYSGELHVSLGMTLQTEEERIVSFFEERGRAKDVVLYSCTSGYPVPFEDLCLGEISRLIARYGDSVRAIGFSGHHLGIAADIAAMTLGARWIERHFTLDRTWRGTDHAASLEPDGLRRLCRDVRNVGLALKCKDTELLPIEVPQREKLKWRGLQPELLEG